MVERDSCFQLVRLRAQEELELREWRPDSFTLLSSMAGIWVGETNEFSIWSAMSMIPLYMELLRSGSLKMEVRPVLLQAFGFLLTLVITLGGDFLSFSCIFL